MVKFPKIVDTERNVEFTQIACGDKHSVALSRNGTSGMVTIIERYRREWTCLFLWMW
jgi:hypothetical protein